MQVDEYGSRRFYGIYRGVVADNKDPLNQGRLKLQIPQVLFDAITDWAWMQQAHGVQVDAPAIGQGVWVQFEGGDPSFPVWVGTFSDTSVLNLSLDQLMDVDTTGVVDGQAIVYDEATSTWIPGAGGGGGGSLATLSDVTISSPGNYQTITYNTSTGKWSNSPVITIADTPPANPADGSLWFDTIQGTIYVYYNDGNTSQWIQEMSGTYLSTLLDARVTALEGIRAVSLGGTGASTLTSGGYLKGNGTSAITSQIGIPAGDITSGTLDIARIADASITNAKLQYSSITLGSTAQALGSTVSNIAGVTINSTTIPTSKTLVTTSDTGTVTDAMLAGSITPTKVTGTAVVTADARLTPSGALMQFAGSAAPTGYLLCDGTSYSTTTYASLFAVIGYTYGGSGANFNVPDLRGRIPVGAGTGVGAGSSGTGAPSGSALTARTAGAWGGVESTALGSTHIPQHTHPIDHDHGAFTSGGGSSHRHWISSMAVDDRNLTGTGANSQEYGLVSDAGSYSADDANKSTGRYSAYESGHTHSIDVPAFTGNSGNYGSASVTPVPAVQPYIVINYIIKT